jgi:hypothetical protein
MSCSFDIDYRYCFDADFSRRLLQRGIRCDALDYPVATYRFHEASKSMRNGSFPTTVLQRFKRNIVISVQDLSSGGVRTERAAARLVGAL